MKNSAELAPLFKGCYWIIPEFLLGGAYPGDKFRDSAVRKITALYSAGIRTIVNLMEQDETDYSGDRFRAYEELFSKLAAQSGAKARSVRFPVRDLGIPAAGIMKDILDGIDVSVNSGMPVYLHCRGGIGRTGTVAGCYLARHGIATGKAALEKISELRKSAGEYMRMSPETPEQRDMVINWRPGE